MLVQFSVSNYMSFNEKKTFYMSAGKARKFSGRVYNDKKNKLTKCGVVFGANASGKSNLISAFQFVESIVLGGLPRGFSNKYFRNNAENKGKKSNFEIGILCDHKCLFYGFSIILSSGKIVEEYLYEETKTGIRKDLFIRNTSEGKFVVGEYFKNKESILKLETYGGDSLNDNEMLFLNIINHGKGRMYDEQPELKVLQELYKWFIYRLNISFPESVLTGYPYFKDTNLQEIAEILSALGTGIQELKIVEIPLEVVRNKMPDDIYNKVIEDLEKRNAKRDEDDDDPAIMLRAYKEFFTFEINSDNDIVIKTIEFSHENKDVFFTLNEESDGTARLLDLVELLLSEANDMVYIIDELDRCLHPAMTVKIVQMFLELAEKRNTQLIFTTHESRLLAEDILRNDEICFVNKDDQGASEIISLDKYQLRADKSIYSALFDGTIDAIPHFNEKKLKNIIE